MSTSPTSTEQAVARLEELIVAQRARCLELARRLRPGLTEDDLTQPHDFPELMVNWHWNYEDGVLAGLLAAQTAIRAR